jgi:hypothetical protein
MIDQPPSVGQSVVKNTHNFVKKK